MSPDLVIASLAAGVLLDNLRLRFKLTREEKRRESEAEEKRAAVALALGGTTNVDGIDRYRRR